MFNIKAPLSLLMIGYQHFLNSPKDFIKLLKWVSIVTLRYSIICNHSTADLERAYNKIANKIFKDNTVKRADIKKDLASLLPDDQSFKTAFIHKSMPSRQSNKKITYLLLQIEQFLQKTPLTALDITLEHILPFTPYDAWQNAFGRNDYSEAIDRLGNMALLPKKLNMGHEPFCDKKVILQESDLKINQHIAQYDDWTIDSLHAHQTWLADQAIALWCFD